MSHTSSIQTHVRFDPLVMSLCALLMLAGCSAVDDLRTFGPGANDPKCYIYPMTTVIGQVVLPRSAGNTPVVDVTVSVTVIPSKACESLIRPNPLQTKTDADGTFSVTLGSLDVGDMIVVDATKEGYYGGRSEVVPQQEGEVKTRTIISRK